jgi:hypothetical protein
VDRESLKAYRAVKKIQVTAQDGDHGKNDQQRLLYNS